MSKPTATNQEKAIATQGTAHIARATSPDMCLVPGENAPVPFDNFVETRRLKRGATERVFIAGARVWTSAGEVGPPSDPAHEGTDKGVVSGTYRGEAVATSYSRDLFLEGCAAVRTDDTTTQNHGNTVGMVELPSAAGAGRDAPGAARDRGIVSHPIDVVSGRSFTLPAIDLRLPGPLPLVLGRAYSSSIAALDFGLGHGWMHTLGWTLELGATEARVYTDEGIAVDFDEAPAAGRDVRGPWGYGLRALEEGIALRAGDGVERLFVPGGAGRWALSEVRDAHGNRIRLRREGERLVAIHDSAGRTIDVETTPGGRLAALTVRDALAGRRVTVARYAYDAAGDLVSVTDALGYTWRYAYDDRHLLVRESDRTGLTFHFVHDPEGRCVETWGEHPGGVDPSLADDLPATLADGVTPARGIMHTRVERLPDGEVRAIDSMRVHRFRGNRHGLLDESDDGDGPLRRAYDAEGRLVARTDATGATASAQPDEAGRAITMTDPLGRSGRIDLDEHGLPIALTDPAGGVTAFQYDRATHAHAITDPTGATTTFVSDRRGQLTEIVDGAGDRRVIRYDEQGNPVAAEHATGGVWQWTYDGLGRAVTETDPLGGTTRRVYSDRGDLLSVHDPLGAVTRHEYDGEGYPTRVIDPRGRATELRWGGYHRLCEGRDATGRTIALRYNRDGEIVRVVGPGGEVCRVEHDAAGRPACVVGFDGGRVAITYDRAGHPASIETPLGHRTELVHDAAGQRVGRRLVGGEEEAFEHDARGALVRARAAGADVHLTRDANGRIVRETQIVEGETHWIESVYDACGERVRKRTSLGHEEVITRAGATASVTTLDGDEIIRRARDLLGREILRELPGGACIESVFDARGCLTRRRVLSPTAAPRDRVDDGASDRLTAPYAPNPVDTTYGYDEARALVEAVDSGRGRTRYAYDPSGRLLSMEREGEPPERFDYDGAGRLAREHEARAYGRAGRLLRAGAVRHEWDGGGRLLEKRVARAGAGDLVFRYAWDGADRLVRVTAPDGAEIEMHYDAFSRRVLKRVTRRAGEAARVTTTRYVWDGDLLVHEIHRTDGALERERTYWFPDGALAPGAHRDTAHEAGEARPGPWFHYVNDASGAPDRLVTSSGEVACALARSAWGQVSGAAGAATATPLRFLGQYEDEETGLFYNRHRYYDPSAGRYISQDPMGLRGGFDLYAYPSDPIGRADPLGLQNITVTIKRDPWYTPPPARVSGPDVRFGAQATPGWFTVTAHSWPYSMQIDPAYDTHAEKNGMTGKASDIADWIRAQPGYRWGTPILLVACSAGKYDDGIAQQLANEMGVEVKAATKKVWTFFDFYWTFGDWRTFEPQPEGDPGAAQGNDPEP